MSKPIEGSVALVEDRYTLIINRGSEHGVKPDMLFAVMAEGGDEIIDPETGDVIGDLPTEKLRVKVFDVQPKYARAETFRTYTAPPVRGLATALTGPFGVAGQDIKGVFDILGPDLTKHMYQPGAFDALTKFAEAGLANPRPVRQEIANASAPQPTEAPVRREVTVNIGDKVRQIVPEPQHVR